MVRSALDTQAFGEWILLRHLYSDRKVHRGVVVDAIAGANHHGGRWQWTPRKRDTRLYRAFVGTDQRIGIGLSCKGTGCAGPYSSLGGETGGDVEVYKAAVLLHNRRPVFPANTEVQRE